MKGRQRGSARSQAMASDRPPHFGLVPIGGDLSPPALGSPNEARTMEMAMAIQHTLQHTQGRTHMRDFLRRPDPQSAQWGPGGA